MSRSEWRETVFEMVDAARDYQDDKFGWIGSGNPESQLPADDSRNDRKLTVLTEELGEVARELNESRHRGTLDRYALHKELAQLAACAVAWIEADLETGRMMWATVNDG